MKTAKNEAQIALSLKYGCSSFAQLKKSKLVTWGDALYGASDHNCIWWGFPAFLTPVLLICGSFADWIRHTVSIPYISTGECEV